MKVLHVIPSVGPLRGGPSEAVLAMCRALQSQGVQTDIVATDDNGPGLLPVSTGAFVDYKGARVHFLQRWSPPINALREFQYSADFAGWLKQRMPDYDGLHVHALFSYLSTRAMQLARQQGRPYILRPLGQLDTWSLKQRRCRKRIYYALVERANVRGAAALHCTSNDEAANVRALLPNARVEVIPHGIEPAADTADAPRQLRQRFGIGPEEPVILFLSRWAPKKNIPLLLEALAGMREVPWTLVLAGSGNAGETEVVQSKIASLDLRERVRCPGHVQGDDKSLLLHGADVFVMPSISENFGVAAAEALCSGLRAVVSRGVDIAPALEQLNGGSVCELTVDSLSAALRRELRAPAGRETLKIAARKHFAWADSARRLTALYNEVFA